MSLENTPILAATIPAFDLFLSAWEAMKADNDLAVENFASILTRLEYCKELLQEA
jgi:hypothetical protein